MTVEPFNFSDISPSNDRYARQRLIHWWDQRRLAESRVVVVGAGALGNEVLKNLALIGVGHILVIDFDVVEVSNLSRCVLFSEADIGRPKAEVAAKAVQRLNPDVRCDALVGDFQLAIGIGYLREYSAVFGCVDSVNARWGINRACMRGGVPWINAGINPIAGEVAVFKPGIGACYECAMTDSMWQRFNQRYSCLLMLRTLPPAAMPTTALMASFTAALQVSEGVALLHDHTDTLRPGQKLYVGTKPHTSFIVDLPVNAECGAHERYDVTVMIDSSPDDIAVRDLVSAVPGAESLELDFDLVATLICDVCGSRPIYKPIRGLSVRDAVCPTCHAATTPVLTHDVRSDSPAWTYTLRELGVPARDILRVRRGHEAIYIELRR